MGRVAVLCEWLYWIRVGLFWAERNGVGPGFLGALSCCLLRLLIWYGGVIMDIFLDRRMAGG
jgi:hypothetical protein